MSPEERQLIIGLFDRVRAAANTPRDPEAEALISDAVKAMPYAPYFLAQAVIVQDQALRAANARLQELESKLNDQGQRPASGGFLSGLGSIFGSGQPEPRPAGPWQQIPQQPPQPAPGPWGAPMSAPMEAPMGGGFLSGALGTAAGVAGGVLLADSLRGLFGGNHGGLGIGSGFGGLGGSGGGETVVNNYYEDGSAKPGGDFGDVDPAATSVDETYDEPDSTDFGSGGDGGTYDV